MSVIFLELVRLCSPNPNDILLTSLEKYRRVWEAFTNLPAVSLKLVASLNLAAGHTYLRHLRSVILL